MTLSKEADDFGKIFVENLKPTFFNLFIGIVLIFVLFATFFDLTKEVLPWNTELKQKIIIFFCLIFFWLWIRKRNLPIFTTDENGILFAFNRVCPETQKILNILYKKVITDIKLENTKSNIDVKFLPEHITVLNPEKAKKIREKSKAKVVIWGDTESGTINSQKKELIISMIRFTYETKIEEKKIPFFNQSITNVILKESWMIDEKEQVIERDYLSKNIKLFSFYLIGWTLVLSNSESDRNNGVEILQQILKNFKKRNNLTNDEKLIVLNLEIQITSYYNEKIRNMNFRFTDKNNNEKIKIGRELLSDIINSEVDRNKYLLFECILDFLENKPRDVLIEKLKKEVEYTNRNDAPVFYSLAFVEYYYGYLENGFKYLKKAINLITPVDQMSSIVGWYEEALLEDNDKKYLKFPIGQIYYNLLESADPERKIVKESLNQFILDYKENKDMIVLEMIDEAEKMLNKIKS